MQARTGHAMRLRGPPNPQSLVTLQPRSPNPRQAKTTKLLRAVREASHTETLSPPTCGRGRGSRGESQSDRAPSHEENLHNLRSLGPRLGPRAR